MTDPRRAGSWRSEGPNALESADVGMWQQKRDTIRNIIRAEVDRAQPIEDARRSIELIAETSIRAIESDNGLKLLVVDEDRRPRTKQENGVVHDFTVRDLIQELRLKHPKLFQESQGAKDSGAPSVSRSSDRSSSNVFDRSPSPDRIRAPEELDASAREPLPETSRDRDWLDVGSPAVSPRDALTTKLRSLERARQQPYPAKRVDEARPPFEGFGLNDTDLINARSSSRLKAAPPQVEGARDYVLDMREGLPQRGPRLLGVLAAILFLILVPYLLYVTFVARTTDDQPSQDVATAASQPEFNETSSIQAREPPEAATT